MISHSLKIDNDRLIAKLALEDGTVFVGKSFGAPGTSAGEVVFNTSMTGYQEILTDPSYCGQIVTMTYPEIGNYGVNEEDVESKKPHLAGFIVRNVSPVASNFRSSATLGEYLEKNKVVGISNIDTRALVRKIRSLGAQKGIITTEHIHDDAALIEMVKASRGLVGRDLVKEVLPKQTVSWEASLSKWWDVSANTTNSEPTDDGPHVVALDFGLKWNIARHLINQGFRVTILPGTATANEVLAEKPDGVFLSNGPGDPEPLTYAIETIQHLLGKVPVFGICLGHQLLALACGAQTKKMKFGHRGANHPVLEIATGKIEITSQNHGFVVSAEGLPKSLEVTHTNLNDDTIAGLNHLKFPAFSVQYHPEASAGPHDSQYLFTKFRELIDRQRATSLA